MKDVKFVGDGYTHYKGIQPGAGRIFIGLFFFFFYYYLCSISSSCIKLWGRESQIISLNTNIWCFLASGSGRCEINGDGRQWRWQRAPVLHGHSEVSGPPLNYYALIHFSLSLSVAAFMLFSYHNVYEEKMLRAHEQHPLFFSHGKIN